MGCLYEDARPHSWDEVAGQEKIIRTLDSIRERSGNLGGRAFWIQGPSGTGKTTIGRLIAEELSDSHAIYEEDAKQVTADWLNMMEGWCRRKPIHRRSGGEQWHTVLINEAHGLSSHAVSRLQTILEDKRVQCASTWIFTTTNKGQLSLFDRALDAQPLLSRCIMLNTGAWDGGGGELNGGDGPVLPFAMRLRSVAQKHGLDGRDLKEYVDLVRRNQGNLRKCFNEIESGAMLP